MAFRLRPIESALCAPIALAPESWLFVLGFGWILTLLGVGCQNLFSDSGQFDGQVTGFEIGLLLQQPLDEPLFVHQRCDIPIYGPGPFDVDASEADLRVVLSQKGQVFHTGQTDQLGQAQFSVATHGYYMLELSTADSGLRLRFDVPLLTGKVSVFGRVGDDKWDLNQDGTRSQKVLWAEVLPDQNDDGVSDTGRRSRWVSSKTGAVGYVHLGGGISQRVVLDQSFSEIAAVQFHDRDGDLIADEEDLDVDGDGILNNQESLSLGCPGFYHGQLTTSGSKHTYLVCDNCHLDDAAPLWCDDCHSPSGRTWIHSPVLPSQHYLRACEQCHIADQPWSVIIPEVSDHSIYPLDGAHLGTDCFRCHNTGNVYGIATSCAGCHQDEIDDQHPPGDCEMCHTTQSWEPIGGGG